MFNSLKLSIVVTVEIFIKIAVEVLAKIINRIKLKPNYSSSDL